MSNITLISEADQCFTSVSNIFIEKYVPEANGEFVKIYLYILRMFNKKDSSLSVTSLADIFNQTENDILRAIRYWEKLGVLNLSYSDEEKKNISSIMLRDLCMCDSSRSSNIVETTNIESSDYHIVDTAVSINNNNNNKNVNNESKTPNSTPETFKSNKPSVATEFSLSNNVEPCKSTFPPSKLNALIQENNFSATLRMAETYFSRPLTSSEINAIIYYHDILKFSAELIDYLIESCVSKGHVDIRYIDKVALNWAGKGISTVAQAKEESLNHNSSTYGIMKAFGLSGRNPGSSESTLINKWTSTYNFDSSLILEACNRTIGKIHQPSFEYADSILMNWHKAGIKTLEDVAKADAEYEANKLTSNINYNSKKPSTSNRFNNFQQRNNGADDWDTSLLRNNG